MLDTIFPVGSMYTQYPGALSPKEIFENAGYSGSSWVKQFNSEGVTFRTEGGGATSFGGGVQQDAMQRIYTSLGILYYAGSIYVAAEMKKAYDDRNGMNRVEYSNPQHKPYFTTAYSPHIEMSHGDNASYCELIMDTRKMVKTADETRMKNRTFIVWRRIR